MNLFDCLVNEALRNQQGLSPLRSVVEKELLHHDILREMSRAGLLASLTLTGGACLRMCYGSSRSIDDLDFAGGAGFTREQLFDLAATLVNGLQVKYGLRVDACEPTRKTGSINTWRVTLQIRPEQPDEPAQRINIDICAIPIHEPQVMMLRNQYGVDMGTSGLIVQAPSREEILADTLVAFALRPNRLMNRDLWDIAWLRQQGVVLPQELLLRKLSDHGCAGPKFVELLAERQQALRSTPQTRADFQREVRRLLPAALVSETIDNPDFWNYLTTVVADQCRRVHDALGTDTQNPRFRM